MRTITVVENVSLDGVMQAPGRPDEDPRGGFVHGGWATACFAADPGAAQLSFEGRGPATGMLFGRRTYEDLVGYWLSTTDPNPFTEVLRSTPKFVASRTLAEPLAHPESHLLSGDLVESVAALRAQGEGELVVLGSGDLVRQLAAAGLVDQYVLSILPVVLGSGTRLFGDTRAPMEVVKSVTSQSGIVVATYRVLPD